MLASNIKDLFSQDGSFISPKIITLKFKNKRNWCCEYIVVKQAISRLCKNVDTQKSQYINVRKECLIWCDDKIQNAKNLKSNNFYWLLVNQKTHKNYMEKVWPKKLGCNLITREMWGKIYMNKCHSFQNKTIGIFNYKLLTN
jgi:hypothetical protein